MLGVVTSDAAQAARRRMILDSALDDSGPFAVDHPPGSGPAGVAATRPGELSGATTVCGGTGWSARLAWSVVDGPARTGARDPGGIVLFGDGYMRQRPMPRQLGFAPATGPGREDPAAERQRSGRGPRPGRGAYGPLVGPS
jgi:hypothetical protein